ncbi:MAG: rhamnulokinase [Dysgonamonadaceae bacterium]|jgi:rhamnulokinase|nr:rhamnulokinase [Dysgonamonadaceae bacterium]
METQHFISFDIGATSGRTILAKIEDGKLFLKELTRFPNKIIRIKDRYYWEIFALYEALKDGLRAAVAEKVAISSIGIDTWGVDFAYIGDDDAILGLPRSYRDPYTNGAPEEFFKLLSKEKVYGLTGIQIMNFNSLYQLYAAKKENNSALTAAKGILFMPDALSFLLTGKKVCEYTIASTSQLINPWTKNIEPALAEKIGINLEMFAETVMPGKIIGTLADYIVKETGLDQAVPVIAVAGHDTASAVAAVPAENERFAYLSSGTWSLMGIELKEPVVTEVSYQMNFTNEGGVDGTIRFLKNITGMWLLEQSRKEWEAQGINYSYPEIVEMAQKATAFRSLIDPDAPDFANPESMTEAIAAYCQKTGQPTPDSHAAFIRCIFDSLAMKYRYVFNCLRRIAPFEIDKLHVIGGGSQNKLLNQFTADAIGVTVVAGPSEATAIGNVMIQAKGLGIVNSLWEMREMIRNSCSPEIFEPRNTGDWDKAYEFFYKNY